MPELPEVEVVRRGLEQHVQGRTLVGPEVLHPRAARHNTTPRDVEKRLDGAVVQAVERRGKFLWLVLGDEALLVHLGMSGQMLMKGPEETTHRHLRARVHLDDGNQLWFVDQRTFGYWSVVPLIDAPVPSAHQRIPASIAHIAPDLLDPTLDLSDLARAVKQKDTEVKRVLLDQRVVSGIGNIYADEMLWQAGLHGRQRASRIATSRLVSLLEVGQSVMERALLQGGTSFDDLYVNVNGESGYFDVSLNAYGQQGKPCPRCGDAIVREEFMNRGSHFCPTCQKEY